MVMKLAKWLALAKPPIGPPANSAPKYNVLKGPSCNSPHPAWLAAISTNTRVNMLICPALAVRESTNAATMGRLASRETTVASGVNDNASHSAVDACRYISRPGRADQTHLGNGVRKKKAAHNGDNIKIHSPRDKKAASLPDMSGFRISNAHVSSQRTSKASHSSGISAT